MATDFILEAEGRSDVGKGASRRLRRAGRVPAILYGAGKDPASLSLEHRQIAYHLENEAFYSHILTVRVDGKDEQAVLKDLQRHPFKPKVLHVDLQRVSAGEKIRVHVPLHFLHEDTCKGVKAGGILSHNLTQVEVSCLPKNLPEFIEVDVAELDLDGVLHLSELKMPAGVELIELIARRPAGCLHPPAARCRWRR